MRSLRKAFQTIKREIFLLPAYADDAALDVPLPIGFGQTNSQPTTVWAMLEWLEVGPGDKTLDVGAGSGWTTALLAYMVAPEAVYGVETVPELVRQARHNCTATGVKNAKFFQSHHTGLPAHAPYDRILVSASVDSVPEELIAQLSIGGKMIIPVHDTVLEIIKITKERLDIIPHPGFAFVPVID
jgi:protein-L-isoaspartate(D-aspartate) O-methyltransferase